MPTVATISLSEPAYIVLAAPNGTEVSIDALEARRVLADAEKLSEAERVDAILNWVARQLNCDRNSLAENQAWEFNDLVAAVTERLIQDRKKKAAEIASSLDSTQASPQTSASGQTT